ncbi:hypothetical protein AALB_2175 [Agarivorans albus MKT 106]|uniref:Uncharacterized protein n=1 Tax=Agarivorans albus MKT 106 TaxID=1331007 RepID=R9PL79_AGAAL|nr:hypothetical protein AALB_2175 [Agarivorans albus MKT 106]
MWRYSLPLQKIALKQYFIDVCDIPISNIILPKLIYCY